MLKAKYGSADGNRPYIGKKDFGFIAGVGRLHHIYYLQRRGAKLLADTLHGTVNLASAGLPWRAAVGIRPG